MMQQIENEDRYRAIKISTADSPHDRTQTLMHHVQNWTK